MEELETLEGTECPECPGPPPEFRLPPPPRPPFLTEGTFCSEAPLAELEDCVAIPMIDASYHTNPSLQSTALIITSAVILLLMAAIISVVFWKHKRKVQNLLPCKSAAGAAAAAAAAAASGRGRGGVLADGQGVGSGSVLYEDLPDAVSHTQHSQVHNNFANHHHPSNNHVQRHPHHRPNQPTIEVREIPEAVVAPRTPAPHHLDYLDYRDPRAILRVADKPSRAVLGGYRTPRALLAKSQGVPLAMANQTPVPLTLPQISHNISQIHNTIVSNHRNVNPNNNRHHIHNYPVNDNLRRISNDPITPTHRPRLRTPTDISPVKLTPSRNCNRRRPSVDSEGYSFVDFRDAGVSQSPCDSPSPSPAEQRLLVNKRSNSVDSDGYSYIDAVASNRRTTPGLARRVIVSGEGTDEEVCPLCTVQRIHGLLSRPEEAYLGIPSESS